MDVGRRRSPPIAASPAETCVAPCHTMVWPTTVLSPGKASSVKRLRLASTRLSGLSRSFDATRAVAVHPPLSPRLAKLTATAWRPDPLRIRPGA